MTNGFKKFLCEKASIPEFANVDWNKKDFELLILIKAMWQINRENIRGQLIWIMPDFVKVGFLLEACNRFYYKHHNNSEQQTLEKALEYIYERRSHD